MALRRRRWSVQTRPHPGAGGGVRVAVVATTVAVITPFVWSGAALPASAAPPDCAAPAAGGPIIVTATCVDPQYSQPVIDTETDVTAPVRHHKVSGHFEGTTAKFTFYFPVKSQWKGRFFQSVYPLQGEIARDDPAGDPKNYTAGSIAFGAASGAYTVQTNGTSGYRVDAAAAKFSKTVAARYYQTERQIYGYVWGGSGGSFMSISGLENTQRVWDGGVPYVVGTPSSIPNNFFVRAFARFVLGDRAEEIADAVAPGGSGNPFAGLSGTERRVLREVSRIGVPLRAWEDSRYLLGLDDASGLLSFLSTVRRIDPTYAGDFWTQPGYLGTEQTALGALVRGALVEHTSTITEVDRDATNTATSLRLDTVPALSPRTAPSWLDFTVYAADGETKVGTLTGSLNTDTKEFTIASGASADVLSALAAGAQLKIDNRWYLAALSYHRHQIPKDSDFYPWRQYLDANGQPIYPQRSVNVGQVISNSVTGGGTYTGQIKAKTIIVEAMLDTDAFPWQGDWYAQRVRNALADRFDSNFRIYYNDNVDHQGVGPARTQRLVSYDGILQQALRDVSAWAEKGTVPPQSTRYRVVDSQVQLPASATERRGIQPVVNLQAGHDDRVGARAGRPVTLTGHVQAPPRAGSIVELAWDLRGDGAFESRTLKRPSQSVRVAKTVTFTKPGTYYVALRATEQRKAANASSPFARVQNLDRVRVVVRP